MIPVDIMWVALSDDKGVPENEAGVESIAFRGAVHSYSEVRLPDHRYAQAESGQPGGPTVLASGRKISFQSDSPQQVHYVAELGGWRGGRANRGGALSESLDYGFGGCGGSQASQDYQVAGLLNFKVKKNLTLFGGWRYLDVDYRNNSNLFLYDITVSGAGLGAVFWFK